MKTTLTNIGPAWKHFWSSDTGILIGIGLIRLLLIMLVMGQYGFHRDELSLIDDARRLDWGYMTWPPFTPFVARVALTLFGTSLWGLRLFSALAQSIVAVLAGFTARELGGSRLAQILTTLAVAIAPATLSASVLFQYVTFDYLWWVLCAYLVARLIRSGNPRWWLGIGATIGMGMLTKYTMAVFVLGLAIGVLVTPLRRYITSRWLWGGVGLALLIFMPNLIWQLQHNMISYEYLIAIHARDVQEGRHSNYVIAQFFMCANVVNIPLWIAGLYYYFFTPAGKTYRSLAWMSVTPYVIFLLTQGQSYYVAPAYPSLLAAGAVLAERWLASLSPLKARVACGLNWGAMAISGALFGALVLPVAPINSAWWDLTITVHNNFAEQIGWPEFAQAVAGVYDTLSPQEKSQAVLMSFGNNDAGALELYGPALGLPHVIGPANTRWLRGYGDHAPEVAIVVMDRNNWAPKYFQTCQVAARYLNPYNVKNLLMRFPEILICRDPAPDWPTLWQQYKRFH